VFEGQRLALNADEPAASANAKPQAADIRPASAVKPAVHKHYTYTSTSRRAAKDETAPKPEPSTLSRLFGTR
jgi:hypothetical protein